MQFVQTVYIFIFSVYRYNQIIHLTQNATMELHMEKNKNMNYLINSSEILET